MPDSFSERAKANILPLSHGRRFPAVFEEWRVSGQVRDHGATVATCQLCEQEHLRYHFEILNEFTSYEMWVGSNCILRFGVAVYDGQRRLTRQQARKKLASLIEQVRYDVCMKALRKLVKAENNEILASALRFLAEHGSLSPRFAFVVFWRLQEHQIEHNPAFFKINLRRQKFLRDLEAMPLARVHVLWPALSGAQRRKAIGLGITPPPAE